MHTLYIFGGSSTALEIADAIPRKQAEVFHVVPVTEPHDGQTRIRIDRLEQHLEGRKETGYILSMTDVAIREECQSVATRLDLSPRSVIHPLAFVSPTAKVAQGAYLAAHSVVSANAVLQPHAMINFHALVGHDATLGEHCRLNPGARIGGNATIGDRVLIGANSFVYQGTKIGEDSVVDAMTSVRFNLSARQIISQHRNNGRPLKRPLVKRFLAEQSRDAQR
ncbi:DapH/DapD/GlmU-related protein [Roseiconus lacunae]|uniref:DapH/DapD/GlmU-related protein n=1 Tax=Roseiconus lacunae TaxID=2605694 RepID=A0ABT7PDG9_9BACT|nr:DapH/DapD/GlmU-related protein [Roseiconus lacunae]MDM4014550.1 DapH/DapD/GlmU-related protein [Roseiconus lacunae]